MPDVLFMLTVQPHQSLVGKRDWVRVMCFHVLRGKHRVVVLAEVVFILSTVARSEPSSAVEVLQYPLTIKQLLPPWVWRRSARLD